MSNMKHLGYSDVSGEVGIHPTLGCHRYVSPPRPGQVQLSIGLECRRTSRIASRWGFSLGLDLYGVSYNRIAVKQICPQTGKISWA